MSCYPKQGILKIAAAVTAALFTAFADSSHGATQTNANAITVSDRVVNGPVGQGSLYPSTVTFAGQPGTVTAVSLTLNNVTAQRPRDLDFLLVAPSGASLIVMADSGNLNALTNVSITLDDAAAAQMTDAQIVTGSYKPTNIVFGTLTEPDSFPAPAPASGYGFPAPTGTATFSSIFTGVNPNGTWSLYVVDDSLGGGTSSIAGGWTLNVTSSAAAVATTTAFSSSPNPSFSNQSIAFTATVTSGSGTPTGTVTFSEGGVTLAGGNNIAVNGSGQAVLNLPAGTLAEGTHVITASYNPTGAFTSSNKTTTQIVNNPTTVSGNQYSNTGAINANFNDAPLATPYPSNIFVSGLGGVITKVTLSLKNLTTQRPRELDVLLVGPGGQKFVPISDTGDLIGVTNITLVLDDAASSQLPTGENSVLAGGTFRPTNSGTGDTFPSPAPGTPYSDAAPAGTSTFANIFNGTSPNGTWSLYVIDDALGGGTHAIAGGWSLTLTTSATEVQTTTAVAASPNPSITGNEVTFTASVTRTSNSTPVTAGSVTFREGASVLSSNVALNGSGQAVFSTSALAEGRHAITAEYNGVAGSFSVSTGIVTQVVNNQTVVTGNQFANPGAITVNDSASTTPYSSNILVSGLFGTITKVTLAMNNMTIPRPREIDVLLVGPGGQKFIPLSDAGDLTQSNGITLILDDAAANPLPTGGGSVLSGGTFRPTDVDNLDSFTAPAPASPYGHAAPGGSATFASTFNGADPNGTWSLYVIDDAIGGGITTIAGGWSLTITTNAAPPGFNSANTTTFTVGTQGSFSIIGTGNPAPTFTTGGSLPTGVTLSSGGVLSGIPAAGTGGSYSFTITAANGVLPNATQNFTLIVRGPPVLTNIGKTGSEDSPVSFSAANFDAGFSDPNTGDTLQTLRITSLPANGVLQLSGSDITTVPTNIGRADIGSLSFVPAPNYNGAASFGWNASDGTFFAVNPALVNISISSVNDSPLAGADTITRTPSQGVKVPVATLLSNDSDPDGGTVAFVSAAAGSGNGAVSVSGGQVFYTPLNGFTGSDTFTYLINDGQGGTATGTVTVTAGQSSGQGSNAFAPEPQPGGGIKVRFAGIPGRTYRVQSSDTLSTGPWMDRVSVTADAQGKFEFVDPPTPPASRFYRAVQP